MFPHPLNGVHSKLEIAFGGEDIIRTTKPFGRSAKIQIESPEYTNVGMTP